MRIAAFLWILACGQAMAQATKEDSGWVSLFDGTGFDDFYFYFEQIGVVDSGQDAFLAEAGMIHVPKADSTRKYINMQGQMFTRKEYSWYRVRVDYKFSPDSGSENAGLLVHVDNASARTVKSLRPRSIEVNMRRAEASPWTLWSAGGLGPYISTSVKPGTHNYQARSEGGVDWTNDPWGSSGNPRVVFSSYPNPEKPKGEWNHGEAFVYGDSLGRFYLNGQLRTEGWKLQLRGGANDSTPAKRIPCDRGGIGLQSEKHEIWYRNFEIMELEPHTLRPIHANATAIAPAGRKPAAGEKPGPERHTLDGRVQGRGSKAKTPFFGPIR